MTAFLVFQVCASSVCHETTTTCTMPASEKAIQLVKAVVGNGTADASNDVKLIASSKPELLGQSDEEKKQVSSSCAIAQVRRGQI
jgi:hypothetical protein